MAARTCAKRTHQLAASILSNGVGPSRLLTASACRCHSAKAIAASTSSFSAPRSFSASAYRHEEESARWEKEEDTHRQEEASSVTTPKPSRKAEKSVRLLPEDEVADAEPTLEYLDSLKPRSKRFYNEDRRPKRGNVNPFAKPSSKGNPEDKQWERTKARISASFTRDQLASLARAAKLPGSYAKTVRKDELVRRIMVHRFRMEDAKERADREKREELEKRSVHISFRPAELYLLLARGPAKVRQEASKAQVAILPQALATQAEPEAASGERLGFWIRGKDDGISRMTNWVESFKQSVKTKVESLTLTGDTTETTGEVLPTELVRFISQASRCFMEASPIQNGKVQLSLAYLDEKDAQKAVLLLRQYQAENAEAMGRIGAAAYCGNLDTLRQYSMLPFVPNEPTNWIKQADDLLFGVTGDVSFRVAHVPELNAFSLLSTTKLPTMKLKGWGLQGEARFEEPFQALLESASPATSTFVPATEAEGKEVELSAQLGHVLFTSGGLSLADENLSEEEVLSRLSDPLAAPRPGTWPIEHVLDWAKGFRSQFGREASRFVPATLFRSQKNISLDIWLERQGYVLAGKGTPDAAQEKVVLVYQPADAGYVDGQGEKLEVVLKREKSEGDAMAGAKGGWVIERAQWIRKTEGDVMIPEKSADLRLTAKNISPLELEALAVVEEGLASYLSSKPAAKISTEAAQVVEDAEAEEGMEDVESDANEMLGLETEEVERPDASATPEAVESSVSPSLATYSKALPPSMLTVASVGTLALESATRMTVQTYQQRSTIAEASSQPATPMSATETETISPLGAAENATTESSEASPEAAATSESDAAAATEVEAEVAAAEPVSATETPAEAEAEIITSDPITTAEVATEEATTTIESSTLEPAIAAESKAAQPGALSPTLIREVSQDLVTKTTTESLRITWRTSSTQPIPEWSAVVEPISALLERHDMSIR